MTLGSPLLRGGLACELADFRVRCEQYIDICFRSSGSSRKR